MRQIRWLLFCLAVTAGPALATVVIKQSLEEMALAAQVVVRGRVGQQQVAWDADRRRIWTHTEIQISEIIKGRLTSNTVLLVRQPGGVVGNIGQQVAGAARFERAEDVLLFLQPTADDPTVFAPLGMAAGKITVEATERGGTRGFRSLDGLEFYDTGAKPSKGVHRVGPARGREDLGTLETWMPRVVRAARGIR